MSLALANAATHQYTDTYVLLDELDIFTAPIRNTNAGVIGLNF